MPDLTEQGGTTQVARLRKALLNVSVHSAHNPGADRELLSALLDRCGEIARDALNHAGRRPMTDLTEQVREARKRLWSDQRIQPSKIFAVWDAAVARALEAQRRAIVNILSTSCAELHGKDAAIVVFHASEPTDAFLAVLKEAPDA